MISVKKNKGFTLVELMVTLGIVGILLSFAVPGYKDYIDKAKISEAISLMLKTSDEANSCLIDLRGGVDFNDCLGDEWIAKQGGLGNTYFEFSNKNFISTLTPTGTFSKMFRIDVMSKDSSIVYAYIPFAGANSRWKTYALPWNKNINNQNCWVINKKGDCYEF